MGDVVDLFPIIDPASLPDEQRLAYITMLLREVEQSQQRTTQEISRQRGVCHGD